MAEPMNFDQMLKIFEQMLTTQLSEAAVKNDSNFQAMTLDIMNCNQAVTGVNAQLVQIKVDAEKSTEKIAGDIKKLKDTTAQEVAALSFRLDSVETPGSSRKSSRAGTPTKIAEPLQIFEPTVITEQQTEIVIPSVTTPPTSREAKSMSSSFVASQSGAQTSVRIEQEHSAKPATDLPTFADIVVKRNRILQRRAERLVLYQAARAAFLNKSQDVANLSVTEQPIVLNPSTSPTAPLQTQDTFTKHSPSDAPTVKANLEYFSSSLSIPTIRSIIEPLVAMSTPEPIYSATIAPCSKVVSAQVNDQAFNDLPKWVSTPSNCFNVVKPTPPSWCDQSKLAAVKAPTNNRAASLVNKVSNVALDSYFVFDPGGQHNIWDPGGLTQLSD